jgi:hypothetical protein
MSFLLIGFFIFHLTNSALYFSASDLIFDGLSKYRTRQFLLSAWNHPRRNSPAVAAIDSRALFNLPGY